MADRDHRIDFASRYAKTPFKTFTASSALWRAEGLLSDARSLQELQASANAQGNPSFGVYDNTYDVISYYSVGFVTCLEWHARSRLVDLMTYKPESVSRDDLHNVGTAALTQMVAARVTVPFFLGAGTHVSTIEKYVAIFDRVFVALGLDAALEKRLRLESSVVSRHPLDEKSSLFTSLRHVFDFRNNLVHEINLAVMGHFTIRDYWTLEDVILFGEEVIRCIRFVEADITSRAPADFPNRLDKEGYEESELGKLQERIRVLEDELAKLLKNIDDDEGWLAAIEKTRDALRVEIEFLESATFLRPIRHLDISDEFVLLLLRNRLTYLSALRSELN